MATTSSTCRPSRHGGHRRWDWAAAIRSSSRSSPARRRASIPTCPAWCRISASAATASAAQRQFHIDDKAKTGECTDFTREMVNAVPWPADNPSAAHANYGMLARDGITCTACHRMVLNTEASHKVADAPQNACIDERQALLNPESRGFARTFTGSFMVGAPDRLIGPFEKPEAEADGERARQHAGPRHDDHQPGGVRHLPHGASAGAWKTARRSPTSTSRRPIRNGRSAPTAPA